MRFTPRLPERCSSGPSSGGYCVYTTASDRRKLFMKKRVDGSGMERRGAHMLIDLIEGRLLSESRVVMRPELTLRGTT